MTTPAVPSWLGRIIGMAELPAPLPVAFSTAAGSAQLVSTACLLLGGSALETSGAAAASVVLHDGSDDTGPPVAHLGMAAGLAQAVTVPPPGIMCKNGLFAAKTAGVASGVAWIIPLAPGA